MMKLVKDEINVPIALSAFRDNMMKLLFVEGLYIAPSTAQCHLRAFGETILYCVLFGSHSALILPLLTGR